MQKTPITTPFDLFEYKRMPFVLRNAGPSFQGHVDRAIRDCHAAFDWVDDIIICSRSHAEHVGTCGKFCRPFKTTAWSYMQRSACGAYLS
jgi:hypothetical protein